MKTLVVIAGPTASGKTSLSIQLASHFHSEIISADSRQFFRKMDIGTAKPSQSELKKVAHHFINSLDVSEKYNIGRFEEDALKVIDALFKSHEIIFLTGGSGLYIDAVCNGIDQFPESDPKLREELNREYASGGIDSLQKRLREVDPEYFEIVDIDNPHRIIRALEVFESTGQKFSSLRVNSKKRRDFEVKKIGLLVERAELYERINLRVDKMIKAGLVEEVRSLLPYRNENSLLTVGYKEIIDHLDNKITLADAIEQIKQNTRNYAKRQMTWFRRDPEMKWFEPQEFENILRYIEE